MSESITRRGFVKSMGYTGAAAAAMTGLAGAATPQQSDPPAQAKRNLAAEKVRIGTLVTGNVPGGPADYIRQILPYGFESFSMFFWQNLGGADLAKMAASIREVLDPGGAVVSSVGVYGNPLIDNVTRDAWKRLIDGAKLFGCNIVAGFAGRMPDKPVPDSMKRFAEVFGPLAKRAADQGVRLAFENCDMGGTWERGDWNIAHNPTAWDLMFNAVPAANIGLQWEPSHQLVNLIEPLPQLRKYVKRVFHIHGKDAAIKWDVIREHRHRRLAPVRLPSHAGLRRQQLDGHHLRAARGGLCGEHRHRGMARSGLPR